MKHKSSHNTPHTPIIATTKPKTEKQDWQKEVGICKESQSFHQVLCVNTELCANAGGEVRGDLDDSVIVA
jgi:hypothetical protein